MAKTMTPQQKLDPIYWLLLLTPILFMPLMINVRVFPFVAPNEEPKWFLFTLCMLSIAMIGAIYLWKTHRTINIRLSTTTLCLAAFYLLLAIGIWLNPNQVEGLIRFSFWFSALIVWLIAAYAAQRHPQWIESLIWVCMVGLFVFCLSYWWGYFIRYQEAGYNISVLFSRIGHINFTGDVLIMLLPFTAWVLATHRHIALQMLAWCSLTTLTTILLVAASRGALGGILLGFLIAFAISLRHFPHLNWKQQLIPCLLLVSSLTASFIIFENLDYKFRDLARVSASSADPLKGTEAFTLTPNVEQPPMLPFWLAINPLIHFDRTSMYASSTAMALDTPWLGQGTGSFPFVYPNYSNRFPDFRDPLSSDRTFTTNPHNMLLQIATQNGIPATLIFIGLLSFFWFRLCIRGWKKADSLAISGCIAISAVIFDAMFNHVFFNPASLFVFALFGGMWWGSMAKNKHSDTIEAVKTLSFKGHRVLASTLLVFAIFLSVWPVRWVMSEWHVGQAMKQQNFQTSSEHYQHAYQLDPYNFRAVFGVGQSYYRQKDFAKSTQHMEWFQDIYPYNTAGLNMLGALYLLQGQLDQAETTLEEALRIYPGYTMAMQNLARVKQLKANQTAARQRLNTPTSPK